MGHGIGRVPVIARRHGDEGWRRGTALCLVAQMDPTAKLGLEALRDEYAQLLAGTISKAQTSAKSMSSDQLTLGDSRPRERRRAQRGLFGVDPAGGTAPVTGG
jgi:hypothetical protein